MRRTSRSAHDPWVWFIAVQWLDVIWSVLVLMGIEKLRIVPGFTEANALDLYYMPYTHGLPGSIVLSLIFGGIVALFTHGKSWSDDLARRGGVIFTLGPRSCRAHARFAALRQCGQGWFRTLAARCI